MSFANLKGQHVGIVTTTMFYTGRLVDVSPTTLTLQEAVWVGETGVWAEFSENLQASESSPFPPAADVHINLAQVIVVFGADEKKVKAARLTKRVSK